MNAQVAVFGTLRFSHENIEQVRPHLEALVGSIYELNGCIAYNVGEAPFDKSLTRFSELRPNCESLEQHLKAPHIEPKHEQVRKYGRSECVF